MDVPSSPSPAPHHGLRRRKKRSTPTNSVPGSSLTGLNRGSIRVVDILRGSLGYGFTISGQKPCLLRCIVEASPADKAGLCPGNCLVGVNGKDVSHLAHDDVVSIIGSCTGLLRLHVADSYFSESSDDECFQVGFNFNFASVFLNFLSTFVLLLSYLKNGGITWFQHVHQTRPKYPHRPRPIGKGVSGSKKLPAYTKIPSLGLSSEEKLPLKCPKTPESLHRSLSPPARRASWDPLMPTPRRVPRPPYLCNDESPIPAIPPRSQNVPSTSSSSSYAGKTVNPNVEIIRVFGHLESPSGGSSCSSSSKLVVAAGTKIVPPPQFSPATTSNDRFNTHSSSGSSSRRDTNVNMKKLNSQVARATNPDKGEVSEANYQAVVGYIGSVEIPEVPEKKRLQAISACVKKLRLEKRVSLLIYCTQWKGFTLLFGSDYN